MLRRARGPSGPPAFEAVGGNAARERGRVAADPDRFKPFPTRKMRRAYAAKGAAIPPISARRPQPGRLHDADSQTRSMPRTAPRVRGPTFRWRPRLRPGLGQERVRDPLSSPGTELRICAVFLFRSGIPNRDRARSAGGRARPPRGLFRLRRRREGRSEARAGRGCAGGATRVWTPIRELRLRAARPRRARPYPAPSITPRTQQNGGAPEAPRRCGSDRALGLTVQSGEGASPSAPVGTPR